MFRILTASNKFLVFRQITHLNRDRFLSVDSSTIDGKEVSHFKQYTSTWWDELGEMKPLHSFNKLRVPFIRDGLINSKSVKPEYIDTPQPLRGLSLLDVGCGGGLLTEPLARIGCQVTGIDATSELIEMAKEHAAHENLPNLTYLTSSVEDHANKNPDVYDAVTVSEVIEHVTDKSRFIAECVKSLKPGGSIFFTTINKTCSARVGALFLAETLTKLIPPGTHDYDKFVEPHVLQRLLEDYNCRTKIVHGMFYNFLTNNWSWMTNTSISYALHAIKL